MKDIIVIIGPTGIGKTKLSIELAKRLDGEIINGDSVAIYKKLDIGSAKPTKQEQAACQHHLIDICELDKDYSVYDYQKDARKLIKEITSRGKRVIIVGGTGLYIKAALFDYQFTEGTIYNSYDSMTNEQIIKEIRLYDSDIQIHPNNRKRLIRTLNKYKNNEVISNNKDIPLYPMKVIGLETSRSILYDRINHRVDQMISLGLLQEIESLRNDYNTSRILNSAIGYKEFKSYLFENETLENVVEQIKRNSRHYAKRQFTFFKHQFNAKWFDINFEKFQNTIEDIYEYIQKEAN